MPRRVSSYNAELHNLNVFVSVMAFFLGLSMLLFPCNLIYSLVFKREPAEQNPWDSKGFKPAAPVAGPRLQLRADPDDHRRPVRLWGIPPRCRSPISAACPAGRAHEHGIKFGARPRAA